MRSVRNGVSPPAAGTIFVTQPTPGYRLSTPSAYFLS